MSTWPISVEEFTERYAPASRRPFSAFLSVSLLVHVLVIILVLLWLDLDRLANRSAPSPVFDVSLSRATAVQDSGVNDDFLAATNEAPVSDQLALQDRPAPMPDVSEAIENLEEAKPPEMNAAPTPEPVEPEPVAVESEVLSTQASSAQQIALVTPLAEPVQAVEPLTQPLTSRELETLQEQLRQWQDEFEFIEQPDQTLTWQSGNQVFQATMERQDPQNNTELERAFVEISTEVDGVRLSTQMAFKRLAFSNYAQLVDRWDRDVAVSEDEIYGRFHSNTRIIVAPERRSEPVFGGKTTIASTISMRGLARRAEIFRGGLETRVSPIDLPKQLFSQTLDFSETEPENYNEYFFKQDGQIHLTANGGFNWQGEDKQRWFDCDEQCFISASGDVELSVEGVVSGTVVIVADKRIRITGNLTYEQHPEEFAESQDYLALLSENYIEIAPPSITGRGDLTVHGALYAKRRFVVRNFRNRNRGLLHLYGSLTAGSLSATEPRYATRIDFDPRFEQLRPPNFPMTNKYELDSWDEVWTVNDR